MEEGLKISLGKDSLWYVPAEVIPALLGFLVIPVYTWLFTPEEYGDYSLAMATVSMLAIFTYVWLNNSNLRFFSIYRNKNELGTYYTTSFFFIGTSVGIICVLIYVLAWLHVLTGVLLNYALVITCLLASTSIFTTLQTTLRSDRKAKYVSLFTCVSQVMAVVLALTLIFVFHMGIVAILLGEFIIEMLLMIIIVIRFDVIRNIRLKFLSRYALQEFFAFGSPFIIMSVCNWILSTSDRYIIEYFLNPHAVGIFYASSQLGNMPITMISTILIMAGYPILIDNYEKNGDKSTSFLITTILKYFLIIIIPVVLGISILAPDFTSLLGNQYSGASAIIPIIALGAALQGMRMYTGQGLQLKNKTLVMSIMYCAIAIVKIAASLILIPLYGVSGAAMASIVAGLCFVALTWVLSCRCLYSKFPVGSTVKSVASGAVMCVGIYAMKMIAFPEASALSFLVLTALGMVIYFPVILYLGELREEFGLVRMRIATDARMVKVINRLL
ncbi:MAG: lipopolysaccharide biosynthesis protein [Candidatus Doudnabacteria bacterium]